MTREQQRLEESRQGKVAWKKWGTYLSDRQWGTVREDYSADGDAWNYFSHDQARSRAYHWGEDGLAGFCDDHQVLWFALGTAALATRLMLLAWINWLALLTAPVLAIAGVKMRRLVSRRTFSQNEKASARRSMPLQRATRVMP